MRGLRAASLAIVLGALLCGAAPSATRSPPVMKKKLVLSGEKYLEQTWLGGDLIVPLSRLSIAEKYYWFGRKNLAMPTELAVRCQLDVDGKADKFRCNLDGEAADPLRGFSVAEADAGLSAAITLGVFDGPTPFPVAKTYGKTMFVRWVRYRLNFEAAVPDKIVLTSGPLVERAQLKGLTIPQRSLDPERYPSRALREERGGKQTLECQVQSDYSIICRTIAFDPPENAPFFEGAAAEFLRHGRAPERLDDGQDSAGARFQLRLRWAVPT